MAGRAFGRIARTYRRASDYADGDVIKFHAVIAASVSDGAKTTTMYKGRKSIMFSTMNPEPDYHKLARAFLMLVEEQRQQAAADTPEAKQDEESAA